MSEDFEWWILDIYNNRHTTKFSLETRESSSRHKSELTSICTMITTTLHWRRMLILNFSILVLTESLRPADSMPQNNANGGGGGGGGSAVSAVPNTFGLRKKFAEFEANVRKNMADLRRKVFLDHIHRRKLRKNVKKFNRLQRR